MVNEIFEIAGKIKAIKERPKNYSILLSDGMWYSGWNNDKPGGLTKDDEVEFKYQINGEYKNIIGAPVITNVASVPTTSESSKIGIPAEPKTEIKEKLFTQANEYTPPVVSRDEQIRLDIRKQSALKSAANYMSKIAVNTGNDQAIAARVVVAARVFEAYLAEQ